MPPWTDSDDDGPSWTEHGGGSSWTDGADNGDGAHDTAAARFEHQLRAYERDKLACRLKLCSLLQLLASSPYVFAVPLRAGPSFGVLSAVAAVVGFWAASGSRRALMRLAGALSVVVIVAGAGLLWRLVNVLASYDPGLHMSTQSLLLTFAVLCGAVVLLQAYTLRLCASMLFLAGARGGLANEAFSFFVDEHVNELLHVDLARTPPEQEAPTLASAAAPHGERQQHGHTQHPRDPLDAASRLDDRESALKLT